MDGSFSRFSAARFYVTNSDVRTYVRCTLYVAGDIVAVQQVTRTTKKSILLQLLLLSFYKRRTSQTEVLSKRYLDIESIKNKYEWWLELLLLQIMMTISVGIHWPRNRRIGRNQQAGGNIVIDSLSGKIAAGWLCCGVAVDPKKTLGPDAYCASDSSRRQMDAFRLMPKLLMSRCSVDVNVFKPHSHSNNQTHKYSAL